MRRVLDVRTAVPVFILALGLGAVGCGDDDDGHDHEHDAGHDAGSDSGTQDSGQPDAGGDTLAVRIDFEARVGSEPFDCGEMYTVGTESTRVMPLDFKVYVHEVAMLTEDGSEPVELEQDGAFQTGEVAMLDFEDDTGSCSNGTSQVNTAIRGSVPKGDYTGVSFVVGIPESLNHGNPATAPSPLNIEGMFWSWTTGYKFLRIDVAPMHAMADDAGMDDEEDAGPGHPGGASGFLVHLGSTMCSGDPAADEAVTCQRSNRPAVRLEGFDPSTQKIVLDLAELLATSDVSMDQGGAPGCMSGGMDPECGPVFGKLGLELATGEATGNPAFLSVTDK